MFRVVFGSFHNKEDGDNRTGFVSVSLSRFLGAGGFQLLHKEALLDTFA